MESTGQELAIVRCDSIVPSPVNRRKGRNLKIEELAESIRQQGLIQTPLVRPIDDNKYEIVAGERRWRACSLIGETMPVEIRQLTDEQAHEITFAENFEREELTPLEQAEFISVMLNDGKTAEQIADRFSKSAEWVLRRAKLCNLTNDIRSYIEEDPESGIAQWPVGHLELVARYEVHIQDEILNYFKNRYYNSRVSLDDLKEILSDYMMNLNKVPWKLDDAELLPSAGSCASCTKRSGVQVSLFDSDEVKQDRCLDKTCWKLKYEHVVIEKEQTLRLKNQDLVIVKSNHNPTGLFDENEDITENAIEEYKINECKKSDPGAVQALIVNGPNAGKTKWIQPLSTKSGAGIGKPATYEEKLEKFSKRRRVKVLDKLMGMLSKEVVEPSSVIPGLDDETIVTMAIIWGTRRYDIVADDPDFDAMSDTLKHFRMYTKIRKNTVIYQDLARCVFPGIVEILKWNKESQNASTDFAEELCEILKIDFNEIVRNVELEIKEPKSLRDLKPEETPEEPSEQKGKHKGRSKKPAEVEEEESSNEDMDE